MLHIFRLLWIGLFAAAIYEIVTTYPDLPQQIAVHFDASGQPDSVGEKNVFYAFFVGLLVFLNILFFSISLLIRKIPLSMISVPWKSYWCANEDSTKLMYRKLGEILAMAGVLVSGSSYLINLTVMRCSTSPAPCPTGDFIRANLVWIILGCTFIFLILSFLFLKPKSQN